MNTPSLDLIGSAEAARILEVDRSTFLRWAAAGKITPAVAGNGRTGEKFFNRSDVEALAAERDSPASKRVAS
ncbi:MAG: helix-turn-helix transcriptional regulator [Brevibacterium sp.]|uniref:helix-turn-helix transcriptional regulator n=1 Tax=Brevibacterium sp. TaxID=1701 RepID=UPI003F8EBEF4